MACAAICPIGEREARFEVYIARRGQHGDGEHVRDGYVILCPSFWVFAYE